MNRFFAHIGRTRSEAGFPREYDNYDELFCIYILIKLLLSIVKETDIPITHTVLENLKFEEKTLINPSVISKRFRDGEKDGWVNFQKALRERGIEKVLEEVIPKIRDAKIGKEDEFFKSFLDKFIEQIRVEEDVKPFPEMIVPAKKSLLDRFGWKKVLNFFQRKGAC